MATSPAKPKRKSVKEMKETINAAGYRTADLFERAEIEQRYAEALDRLAEAHWMESSAAAPEAAGSSDDDDEPADTLIPPKTGKTKSNVKPMRARGPRGPGTRVRFALGAPPDFETDRRRRFSARGTVRLAKRE